MISDAWKEYARKMKDVDTDNFLSDATINSTINSGMSATRKVELERIPPTSRWLPFIIPGNGTSVHQAYSLSLYEEHMQHLSSVSTILEFGAGYGEMARMIMASGWKGEYIIYDLPELIRFQRKHLRRYLKNIRFISNPLEIKGIHPDLLIAICSISESPLKMREIIMRTRPSSLLIRYQKTWDNIDNVSYFTSLATNYAVSHQEDAVNFPNHSYLVTHTFLVK